MRLTRLLVLAAILALALIAAAACGGGGGASTDRELRVGYAYGFDAGDVGDRVAFRELEREKGIRASFQEMGGGRNVVIAVERGDIDVGNLVLLDAIRAVDQGVDLKAILVSNQVAEFVLVAANGVTSVEGLKGKTIAFGGQGDQTNALASLLLQQAGVAESDVGLVALPESTNRATALLAGRIDAAVIEFVDYLRISSQKPGFEILGSTKETSPFPINTVYVVSGDFARKNPELVQDLVSGLLDGYERLYGPEGGKDWKAEAKATALEGESDALVAKVYAFYRDVGFWPRRTGLVARADYDRGTEFWVETGQLERGVPFDRVWDLSFWRKAAEG